MDMANLQSAHSVELKKEQDWLVAENEKDAKERMKLAWQLIDPNTDFDYFNLMYQYASEVYDNQQLNLPAPPSFKE